MPSRLPSPCHAGSPLLLLLLIVFATLASSNEAPAQTTSEVYSQAVEAFNRGDLDGAKQKLQRTLEIDPNFRPATGLLARIAAAQRPAAAAPGLSAKALEHTVFPVEFNNTPLTGALEYIRQKAAETSGGKLQLNFAMNLPPGLANKKITLKLDRVPVSEVLRYMGESAGVSFEKQQYAIVVTPAPDKSAVAPASPAPVGKPNS